MKTKEEEETKKQEILVESLELTAENLEEYSQNTNLKEFIDAILKISNKNSINKAFQEGKQQTLKDVLKIINDLEQFDGGGNGYIDTKELKSKIEKELGVDKNE